MKVKARFLLLAPTLATFVALGMTAPSVNATDEAHSPLVLAANTTSQSAPYDPLGLSCWWEDENTYCCRTQYGVTCMLF